MLGVDIGTTSTKTVVFTLDGKVLAQYAEEYPVICTEPGMAEQDPDQIVAAALASIGGAVKAAKGATRGYRAAFLQRGHA
jgi:Sugar (pentulose and hexulose) kinases